MPRPGDRPLCGATVAGRRSPVASGTTPLLDRGVLHMSSKSNPEILAKVAYLEFVHDVRKRGKALLGSLVELQVRPSPPETPFEPRRFHVVENPRELSDGIWETPTRPQGGGFDRGQASPPLAGIQLGLAEHVTAWRPSPWPGCRRGSPRAAWARRPRRRPDRGRFYRCRWANDGHSTGDEVANPYRDWWLRQEADGLLNR